VQNIQTKMHTAMDCILYATTLTSKPKSHLLLCVDELLKIPHYSEILKSLAALLSVCRKFWTIVSTLDAIPVFKTFHPLGPFNSIGSGRLIRWIPLPIPSLSEVLQIRVLVEMEQKLPLVGTLNNSFTRTDFRRLIEYCGGHFRTLENVHQMFSLYVSCNNFPTSLNLVLADLMDQANINQYHSSLELPYIVAALRNEPLQLDANVPGTDETFRSLIKYGTFMNTFANEGEVANFPRSNRFHGFVLHVCMDGPSKTQIKVNRIVPFFLINALTFRVLIAILQFLI
jgi:hypothetical protein